MNYHLKEYIAEYVRDTNAEQRVSLLRQIYEGYCYCCGLSLKSKCYCQGEHEKEQLSIQLLNDAILLMTPEQRRNYFNEHENSSALFDAFDEICLDTFVLEKECSECI
jgi:CDGSH-type Zn-finger protein